jgi:DNA-binding response OmpR family regulator
MAVNDETSGKDRPRREAPRARKRKPSLGRALVVEDDALLAMMIAEALQEGGASHVSVCPSIASALAELDRLKPDILVLDVHLADRDDGWTLAELVMELSPQPPIIVFSTGSPESIPARIAELGTVLVKPFAPGDLVVAVLESRKRSGLFSRLKAAISHPSG